VEILAVTLEVDDRIANELSRAMKRHVSAPLDLEQLYPFALQKSGRRNQVLLLRCSAEGHYRRVLDEEQDVLREGARYPIAGDVPLELERFGIGHSPQRYSP
jgi:hypothetical protein